jgi:hypothetical protein
LFNLCGKIKSIQRSIKIISTDKKNAL